MFRQGDILIIACDCVPQTQELEAVKRDEQNRIILAYGEATGHAHAIKNKNAFLFKAKNSDNFFLIVKKPAELVHEEHHTINLPAGNYKVIRQRFYTPTEIKNVAD